MARDLDIAREYTRSNEPNPRRRAPRPSRHGVAARAPLRFRSPATLPSDGVRIPLACRACPGSDGAAIFRHPLADRSPADRAAYTWTDGPCAPVAAPLQGDGPRVHFADLARRLLFTRVSRGQNRFVKALGLATPPSASCARSRSGRFFIASNSPLAVSARRRRRQPR